MEDQFEELRRLHEVDQGITEALAMGHLRIVGVTPQGEKQYQLTAKGVAQGMVLTLGALVQQADSERRDFTPAEKRECLEHIETVRVALQSR
jgi:hypothetical protein